MKPLILLVIWGLSLESIAGAEVTKPRKGVESPTGNPQSLPKASGESLTVMNHSQSEAPKPPRKNCRWGKPQPKIPTLCGNKNQKDDRCLFACIAGGFYQGYCGKANECFCYRDNPDKGFIIEKRHPILRKLKPGPGENASSKTEGEEQSPKEISIVTDDYTSGYVDVDVNVNLEWDLSYLSEWFQSFNFYNNLKCDPCLCPAGCAIYGYFSGFCTPAPSSECMCATAAKKPI